MKKSFVVILFTVLGWTFNLTASPQLQDTAKIEKELLSLLNKERTARSLKPLRLSPDIRAVAIRHSTDMASRQKLSHISSSGESYLDRLVEAEIFFIEIGENVAASDTFDPEFIHQGFMESPEHRANILNPTYDTAGIGVVFSQDRRYFVTQDFIQSLTGLEKEEAEFIIKEEINDIRKESALPPLSFHNVADSFARRHSRNKASGKPLQKIAEFFGETHIHFITTPVLAIPDNIYRVIASAMYEIGAVGAWFGRLQEFPGGAYVITIFLFPVSPYDGMAEEDYPKMVLNAVNARREINGLVLLKLDKRQSKKATDISNQLRERQGNSYTLIGGPVTRQVLCYVTENPGVWPANLDAEILTPGLRKIGIGISSRENQETRKRTFWITLIL
jgi:uncharacterized protein YkwD